MKDRGRPLFNLARVLKHMGVSQRALAARLRCKQAVVSRYYNGHLLPSWPNAVKIATALGVSVGVFCENDAAALDFFTERKGA